jgi:hypothetical protein
MSNVSLVHSQRVIVGADIHVICKIGVLGALCIGDKLVLAFYNVPEINSYSVYSIIN